MQKANKIRICLLLIDLLLFIVLSILLKTVDLKNLDSIGQIGLYSINSFSLGIKESAFFDILGDIILAFAIICILLIALIGIMQLIKTKKIFSVNNFILSFGITLVILVILYFIFDKVLIINYRPNGENECSYPSTHVLIVCFTMFCLLDVLEKSKINRNKKIIGIVIFSIICIAICVLRIVSKSHWLTDIIGSILLALFLSTFCIVLSDKLLNYQRKHYNK